MSDKSLFKINVDQGPADRDREGAYRRGYHQAVAEIAHVLRYKHLSADELDSWVEEEGMHWRKDVTLDRMITPPAFGDN